ncbi:SNF2 family N-terminal domain-containing protein [Parasitella parasitica]|nr:SNF2 family N-terminal domain-containing protein [Parasitella parasitica]
MSQEEEEEQEEEDSEDSEDDDDSDDEERRQVTSRQKQSAVVDYFNTCSSKDLQILSGCKATTADKLIELRPFADEDELETKLRQTKGLSVKLIEYCYEMMSGYRAVDQIIKKIENLGNKLRNILSIWEEPCTTSPQLNHNGDGGTDDQPGMALTNVSLDSARARSAMRHQDAMEGYITQQPDCVNPSMTLKDYQVLGVNWMLLLYRKGISGILADEMGLGKTAQVISFLGRLHELGESGPHLIIVPSSTIQNWEREFERFCPSLEVRLYHGSLQERMDQRIDLLEENDSNGFQVIITTYNLAAGNIDDRKFFKRLRCRSMILDEGHMIKNCTSARYKSLMSIKTPFRLLLTGTPLQNNLQELVSLLTFIMPETFANHEEDIRSIFKIRKSYKSQGQDKNKIGAADDTSIQVLAKERINRAKKMMTPFVLRRKKENVLKDLPKKEQVIERCDMTEGQAKIYTRIIEQTKKKYEASLVKKDDSEKKVAEKKTDMAAQFEDMSNVVIHLRKAADHPLLFRNLYTDDLLRRMAKELHQDVKYWDSNLEYMYEDMTVMSDFELDRFCKEEKKIKRHCLKNQEWMDSGKVEKLKELLPKYKKKGNKVLIFSQFTKMLDILELVLETIGATFLRLDGETKVMDRQSTIDDFNENADIDVFLLSTKAGGFGINLTSSNVVIMYDIDFNPQNDKQAEDRAHRVGQTKDVIIHKLISNGSIEEYILKMADMKLRLDKNISSNDDEQQDDETSENQKGLHSILQEAFIIADNRQK